MAEINLVTIGQLLLPLLLIFRLGKRDGSGRVEWVLSCAAAAAGIGLIGVAGIWLLAPWYTAYIFAGLGFVAAARGRAGANPGDRQPSPGRPWGRLWRIGTLAAGALACCAALTAVLGGHRSPADLEPVELKSPLRRGTYYVMNGGYSILINPHMKALNDPALSRYRGQSYALDLVKLGAWGLRAPGFWPDNLQHYEIYGEEVVAPCAGRVLRIEAGLPDLIPPAADRTNPAGNYVYLECGGRGVFLAHLQAGSVSVSAGQAVREGDAIGRVGNSGYTTEPHLHLHAQHLGRDEDFLSADPLPLRLDGRILVRQSRHVPK